MSRAIDKLVAERVMRWKLHKKNGYSSWWEYHQIGRTKRYLANKWSPSTDIAAAWEVVEHLGSGFQQLDNGDRMVNGERVSGWTFRHVGCGQEGEGTASSAPLAICLAALRAVGVPDSEIKAAKEERDE